MANVICPKCGKENLETTAKCWGCGEDLAGKGLTKPARVNWRWVFLGFLILVGAIFLADALSIGIGAIAGERAEPVTQWLPLVGFLVGGIVAGRFSPGATLLEPALAAAVAVIVRLGQQFAAGDVGFGPLLAAVAIGFVLALGGAWIGEKWQGTI